MTKQTINNVEYEIGPRANLRDADLHGADLHGANLRDADLHGANLHGANLRDADLHGANLRDANLSGADLHYANLRGADLSGADLHGADLHGADLHGADLHYANLSGADLHYADLRYANLCKACNVPPHVIEQTTIVGEGDLIVYKKLSDNSICKLLIPKEAKRSNSTGRKCRAEYAIVLEGEGYSTYDKTFKYQVGKTVYPRYPFDEDKWNECASGIHFFLTRGEAERGE